MNLKLTSFENLAQGRVGFIPWKWQIVYAIPKLVVNTFFQRRIHTSIWNELHTNWLGTIRPLCSNLFAEFYDSSFNHAVIPSTVSYNLLQIKFVFL